jgi:hypothetical protein
MAPIADKPPGSSSGGTSEKFDRPASYEPMRGQRKVRSDQMDPEPPPSGTNPPQLEETEDKAYRPMGF